jgi:hypothetical protein
MVAVDECAAAANGDTSCDVRDAAVAAAAAGAEVTAAGGFAIEFLHDDL